MRGGGNYPLELSMIARLRQLKPRTLDTLSTSQPLCILIIRLRCRHCAALIVHNADCAIHNPPKLCIPHYASLDPAQPTICQCREGTIVQGNRLELHLGGFAQNYASQFAQLCNCTHPLQPSVTIPHCRITRYSHCSHGSTHPVDLYHDSDFWHIPIGSVIQQPIPHS